MIVRLPKEFSAVFCFQKTAEAKEADTEVKQSESDVGMQETEII